MIKNYFIIAFRNLRKYQVFSLINIFGLSLGLTACTLLTLYIFDEFKFDQYHNDYDRIFRIILEDKNDAGTSLTVNTPGVLTRVLKENYPEIEKSARMWSNEDLIVKKNDIKKLFSGENHIYVDSEFFDIFKFHFIDGNKIAVLSNDAEVIISEDIALLYFGNTQAAGQSISINGKEYYISGVIRNLPHNTHLPKVKFITSIRQVENDFGFNSWLDGMRLSTYIKLRENVDSSIFQNEIRKIADNYIKEDIDNRNIEHTYKLQAATDIHLNPNFVPEKGLKNKKNYLLILSAVALLVFLLAIANYINLSFSLFTARTKEISIRKILGAGKLQLIFQFVIDALLISIISIVFAFLLVYLLLPWFNNLIGKTINMGDLSFVFWNILLLFSLIVLVSFGSFCPVIAFFSRKPVKILQRTGSEFTFQNISPRKLLTIFQFAEASVFIIVSLSIINQINYMKNKSLGFNDKGVIVLPIQTPELCREEGSSLVTLKNELKRHSSIAEVTTHISSPGRMDSYDYIAIVRKGEKISKWANVQFIDKDFLTTYEIPLISGHNFTKSYQKEPPFQYILNESAVLEYGFDSPLNALGGQISMWGWKGEIIGVVKDFHYKSLYHKIGPLVMLNHNFVPQSISIKLYGKNYKSGVRHVRSIISRLYPEAVFDYYFLDEDFASMYYSEEKFARIIGF